MRFPQRLLAGRRLPLYLALIAAALGVPALWLGFCADDYYLRTVLIRPAPFPEWSRTPFDVFAFFGNDRDLIRHALAQGAVPWWTPEEFRIAFFRPLSGLTHWLDFRVWPESSWIMHVHSLLWFGAAIGAAALFYRRMLRPAWVAGLAALLFALDDAHGLPAVWLANRNACLGAFLGILALVAHDRWRREGWRPGVLVAPLTFLLGLLAGEIALGIGAYVLAYALFVDETPWPRRLASVLPCGLAGAAWLVAYRLLGYGVTESSVYIDPGTDPAQYARAVLERGPLLFAGQWAFPSDLSLLFSESANRLLWVAACGLAALIVALLVPLLRRDRTARFFGLGMVLSLLPGCATFPDDRLLFVAGLGGMGLLAQIAAAFADRAERLPRSAGWRLPARGMLVALLGIHLVLAPLGWIRVHYRMRILSDITERSAASLPDDPAVRDQQVLIVATPSAFFSTYGPGVQQSHGRPIPSRTLVLGSSIHPVTIGRPEENALSIRPAGGFLARPGTPLPGREADQPAFDPHYVLALLDRLYRGETPMRRGDRIDLSGVVVEISAVTEDGRPAEATFRFDTNLDDRSLRWVRWSDGVYVPFELPALGEVAELPAATVPALTFK